ncbi:hypothetical protein HYT59_02875 [Candidatus Woesebacteria bacterium]|nr:hypothetical protein [Candidatus Woesebacteria bacterium]
MNSVELRSGDSSALVLPDDGGIVASFKVQGVDVLLPDQVFDRGGGYPLTRRGGIFLVFPNFGSPKKVTGEFNLPKHGFARDLPWRIVEMHDDNVLLELSSLGEVSYPYKFAIGREISIKPNKLSEVVVVVNRGSDSMPFVFGYHPYFITPRDLNGITQTSIAGLDLRQQTLDESLTFPLEEEVGISIAGVGEVRMRVSDGFLESGFGEFVVWRDVPAYLCVEPIAGRDIRDPNLRINLSPRKSLTFGFEIEVASLDK